MSDHSKIDAPHDCNHCAGLYDDSDGPEYGPPWPRCSIKPAMENLRGFPFSTPQRCWEPVFWLLVDWEAEAAKWNAAVEQMEAVEHNGTPEVRA